MPSQRESRPNRTAKAMQTFLEKVPPNDTKSELLLLGAIIGGCVQFDEIIEMISPNDFYDLTYRKIFSLCQGLSQDGAEINFENLTNYFHKKEKPTDEDTIAFNDFLQKLSNYSASASNSEYHLKNILDYSIRRKLINSCASIMEEAYKDAVSGLSAEELILHAEETLDKLNKGTQPSTFSSAQELGEAFYEQTIANAQKEGQLCGVSTGYENLDNLTNGLRQSDLVIIAARPSMGKTAFALCMAMNAALQQGIGVGIFSLEMSKEQLTQRMYSVFSKVNLRRIIHSSELTDSDWQRLKVAMDVIQKAPIYIDETPGLTTQEMRIRAKRLMREKNIGMLVIDYLQLMRVDRKVTNRELEISEISRALKALAKELHIPVIALAQLNRKVEERQDKRPVLSDLRESGAIEQDADTIMFVYRDDVYKYLRPENRPIRGTAEIIIGKQRNGPVGTAELLYISSCTSFENMLIKWDQQTIRPVLVESEESQENSTSNNTITKEMEDNRRFNTIINSDKYDEDAKFVDIGD